MMEKKIGLSNEEIEIKAQELIEDTKGIVSDYINALQNHLLAENQLEIETSDKRIVYENAKLRADVIKARVNTDPEVKELKQADIQAQIEYEKQKLRLKLNESNKSMIQSLIKNRISQYTELDISK